MNLLVYMTGGFDRHGPSNHLFATLIEDFLRKGHEVVLVERYSGGPNPIIPNTLTIYKGFSYHCVNVKVIDKQKLIRRYFNSVKYAFKSRKTLKKIFVEKKIDVVLIQSNPTPYFQLRSVRKFFKGNVVFNIQDFFPGSSIATGKMNNKLMQNFFYWFSRLAYKMADYFTVISTDSKRLLVEQGVDPNRIEVIANWYNSEEVKEIPWDKNKFVSKYELAKGPFYVQYAGGMGFVFDYKAIVNAAKTLIDYKDIVFLMVGDGSQKNDFVSLAEKNNLTNIHFFPMQPQEIVADVYSTCELQIIPLNKKVIGNSVPSKAGLLMSCNRLILNSVDSDSDYFKLFNEEKIGVSVSNDDNDALAKSILHFYNNRESMKEIVARANEFGRKFYSREVATGKYIYFFTNISDK